ncbi:MAG TPA: hypothetical protein VHF69_08295, partial [Candidatus Synoicihabitans sp.]|nr:hypothetical protein [Candidatus Synoicihabitans sp.]
MIFHDHFRSLGRIRPLRLVRRAAMPATGGWAVGALLLLTGCGGGREADRPATRMAPPPVVQAPVTVAPTPAELAPDATVAPSGANVAVIGRTPPVPPPPAPPPDGVEVTTVSPPPSDDVTVPDQFGLDGESYLSLLRPSEVEVL